MCAPCDLSFFARCWRQVTTCMTVIFKYSTAVRNRRVLNASDVFIVAVDAALGRCNASMAKFPHFHWPHIDVWPQSAHAHTQPMIFCSVLSQIF